MRCTPATARASGNCPCRCKISALEANTVGFNDLHPSQNNIQKIILLDSPIEEVNLPNQSSSSDKILTYAMRATTKKTGDEGGGSDGCKYDDEGRPECAVQSEKWIEPKVPEVPGFVGADVGNINDDRVIPLPTDLKNRVVTRAGDSTDCGKSIQRLLNKLDPKKKNRFKQSKDDIKNKVSYIESLYNRVEGSIKLVDEQPPFRAETGSNDYSMNGAKITMNQATENFIKRNNYTVEQVNKAYTTVIVHELIHNAKRKGRYTDVQVLNAAIALMKEDGKEPPKPTDDPEEASTRINTSFMRNYCPELK